MPVIPAALLRPSATIETAEHVLASAGLSPRPMQLALTRGVKASRFCESCHTHVRSDAGLVVQRGGEWLTVHATLACAAKLCED